MISDLQTFLWSTFPVGTSIDKIRATLEEYYLTITDHPDQNLFVIHATEKTPFDGWLLHCDGAIINRFSRTVLAQGLPRFDEIIIAPAEKLFKQVPLVNGEPILTLEEAYYNDVRRQLDQSIYKGSFMVTPYINGVILILYYNFTTKCWDINLQKYKKHFLQASNCIGLDIGGLDYTYVKC